MDHDEVMAALQKKLDAGWNTYMNQTLSRSRKYIFEHAVEIAATQTAYQVLQNGGYPQKYLEFLLRFEDPLGVVRDQWLDENNVYIDESMLHVLRNLIDKL